MTKKKLKWLAPLTAGALAVTLGITAISVPQNTTFAQELSSSEVVKLAAYNEETANEALTRDNYGVEYWVKHTPTASITTGEYDGIKYRAAYYTPDFVVDDKYILEVKGYANDVYRYKKKLVLLKLMQQNRYSFIEIKTLTKLREWIRKYKLLSKE